MKQVPATNSGDAETSANVDERRVLSRKAMAKEQRHAAYQRAKEHRATDPRYLAMKEAAKVQRRAAYQKVKERRKAVAADEKFKRKAERSVQTMNKRREADEQLMTLVTWVLKGATAQND